MKVQSVNMTNLSRVMTENCAPVSIQVSVDAVTSRGPLRTRFESVAMCGSQAPVGWGRTQQSEPATERCNRPEVPG